MAWHNKLGGVGPPSGILEVVPMVLIILVLAAGAILLLGFAAGARFSEVNMELRERELARQRRELTEATRRAAEQARRVERPGALL